MKLSEIIGDPRDAVITVLVIGIVIHAYQMYRAKGVTKVGSKYVINDVHLDCTGFKEGDNDEFTMQFGSEVIRAKVCTTDKLLIQDLNLAPFVRKAALK
jgi:hypothetical protein